MSNQCCILIFLCIPNTVFTTITKEIRLFLHREDLGTAVREQRVGGPSIRYSKDTKSQVALSSSIQKKTQFRAEEEIGECQIDRGKRERHRASGGRADHGAAGEGLPDKSSDGGNCVDRLRRGEEEIGEA